MKNWTDPCPYGDPAHDFEPMKTFYSGNLHRVAICRKCGVAR